jgi:hypothetical protein
VPRVPGVSTTPFRLLLSVFACFTASCSDSTEPGPLDGTFTLVAENDQPLPSDPSAPNGCCLTLSGSLTLGSGTYDLRTTHRNKNTSVTFDNSEQGTFVQQGNTLMFTRSGGGGEGVPYLLAPGTVSSDRQTITLLYGDEGPGSNQIRGSFLRMVTLTYGASP